jgi:hypothetical protein
MLSLFLLGDVPEMSHRCPTDVSVMSNIFKGLGHLWNNSERTLKYLLNYHKEGRYDLFSNEE